MLELKNIRKVYQNGNAEPNVLFNGFNLAVNDGDFVSVVGSNGSGKTTLLNIICGSTGIDGGDIMLDGNSLNGIREHKRYEYMGRVYQNPATGSCPELTIAENMALADNKGKRYNLSACVSRSRLQHYRDMLASLGLGLEDKLNQQMGLLSGGQRQAIALLMATMTPIRFLILDEHTAALDPKTADIVMELTDRVIKEKRLTAVMVTHNLRYAVQYGNRIIMMHRGDIVLQKQGDEKDKTQVSDLLGMFNSISVECGN